MDPNLLKNLNLDSSLNQNDLQLLNQILGSIVPGGNKQPKMTAKDKNNLINKLSSNNTLNELPKKELKSMNEEEKSIYREELKQKLRNKQNEKKMLRTSNSVKKNTMNNNSNYSGAIEKITEMVNNIDSTSLNEILDQNNTKDVNTLKQNSQESIINNVINVEDKVISNDNNINADDNLDDYLN